MKKAEFKRQKSTRKMRRSRCFGLVVVVLAWALPVMAQVSGQDDMGFVEELPGVRAPYAGKYEARVGGSRESEDDKLRLDIGASVDLYRKRMGRGSDSTRTVVLSLGADFFTWTRLRASGGFKFPVEAVDYYFGVNASVHHEYGIMQDARLRIAHISAHLVDGDPSFTSPEQEYITYNREFLDLLVGLRGNELLRVDRAGRNLRLRPYIGAQWLFHTIPDTLGVVTPYAGLDASVQPDTGLPLVLRFGYEFRLNTELEPVAEHQLRLGVKLGELDSRGVIVEGSYYSGRSSYGQHFSRREQYMALGFAVEF